MKNSKSYWETLFEYGTGIAASLVLIFAGIGLLLIVGIGVLAIKFLAYIR